MDAKIKKVAVIGAGAVGCFFGGMLARAGKEVTLIAREHQATAIKQNGLRMDCLSFKEIVAINATSNKEDISTADLVLCCVKSLDTDVAAKEIKSFIKADAIVLSLQNGVDNAERLSKILPNPVYPAVVYVATSMVDVSHLKHFGRGELLIGDMSSNLQSSNSLRAIAELFQGAGVPCEVSSTIKRELWLKFLVNCSYNAISAIGQITYGDMVKQAEICQLLESLTKEFLMVAHKEGVDISFEEAQAINQKIAVTMSGQRSSTAQDLMKGKPTEIEFLNGLIVRKAREFGISVPSHQAMYALVKMLEQHAMPSK